MQLDPERALRAPGAWTHRDISANSCRFHLAELGEGPLVVLLHGYPMMWWTWRAQLEAISAAGYRVVAMDLRGFGGSDHPPHGYDPLTMAEDVASVVRTLGAQQAIVIGHGWGGLGAWTLAATYPEITHAIGVVGMPHPVQMRRSYLRSPKQFRRGLYTLGYQLPFWPESKLQRHDAAAIDALLRTWSSDDAWLTDEVSAVYRCVFEVWPTAHTSIEYHRWAIRSMFRPDGLSYMKRMRTPINVPVLQLHGEFDPTMLADSVDGSEQFVGGEYQRVMLPCGHFPHEELPESFNDAVISWLLAHAA